MSLSANVPSQIEMASMVVPIMIIVVVVWALKLEVNMQVGHLIERVALLSQH